MTVYLKKIKYDNLLNLSTSSYLITFKYEINLNLLISL